ncbi:hypothetical protein LTR01_002392 [Friedmanniomyces endolithicus]|nr:hypothetical protein LTS09_010924 [Friedmanniomyces endolithicus]KAK0312730.1 hypothetical protein LTR01_002392 [Friedmanniomyces endolithicus]
MDGNTPTDQGSGLRDSEDSTSGTIGPTGSTARGSAERGRADADVKQALRAAAGEIPSPCHSPAPGDEEGITAGERRGEGGEPVGASVAPPAPQSAAAFSTGHLIEVLGKKDAKICELEMQVEKQKTANALLRDRLIDRSQLEAKLAQLEAANEYLRKETEQLEAEYHQLRRANGMIRALGAIMR